MPRDLPTKYQGVRVRHQKQCRKEEDLKARCNCTPSYYGKAYDHVLKKPVRTRRFRDPALAASARRDLLLTMDHGIAVQERGLRLREARERFVLAAREGRALNKRGKRYKPKAIEDIELSLKLHAEGKLGNPRLSDVRRGDVQTKIVDKMTPTHSGSRVRSVVNALRSLYRWAQERDLAVHDPAQHVRLPALDTDPVERVVTPIEFAALLELLELEDQAIYGLAGYAWARLAQIQRLDWEYVDFKNDNIELGAEWLAAKYEASHRVVPMLPPLRKMMRLWWLKSGRPSTGRVFKPRQVRRKNASGLFSSMASAQRAAKKWKAAKLERITLAEARHSGSTWLDAAGVSPRIQSYLMGHEIPELQPGAAPITLRTYTHVLEADIERSVKRILAYFKEHEELAQEERS